MVSSEITYSAELSLRVKVLDGFALEDLSGKHISVANRKACALLAYLALSQSPTESRERLAGLLWSDRGEEQARASLRQCVKQLRACFDKIGFRGFKADRLGVSLEIGQFSVDLEEIEQQFSFGDIPTSVIAGDAIPARLLYGFEALDPSFTAWLHVARQTWQDRLMDRLQPIVGGRAGVGAETVRRAAEALVAIDATHEEAHRHLIRYHADSGNVPAALKQYRLLWDLLDEEYDMEPAEETQALIAEIKAGTYEGLGKGVEGASRPLPAQTILPARLPKIEICPFAPGGPVGTSGHVVTGFRRDLVACLVRFRNWVVVEAQPAQSAEMAAKQAQLSNADYRIEGSYVAAPEGEVLVTVTLADARTWRYLWSERYSLSVEQWAQTQQKIARRIAVALDVYLSAEGISRQIIRRDLSLEAYDLWLHGQNLMLGWRAEAEVKAAELFKRVIDQMPSFAPAYSSLANIFNTRHIVTAGYFRQPELEMEALRLAKKSVELDPLETRSQLTLAWSYAMAGRYDQAEIHYDLAHDLNTSDPTTLISCAHGLAFCDRKAKAEELAAQAIELHPMMPSYHWGFLVGIRFICEDYRGSVEAAERAGTAIHNLPGWKAAALSQLERVQEARQAGQEFLAYVRERWAGAQDCDDVLICRWFLQSFPIRNAATRHKLTEGLRMAGLPV